MFNSVTYLLAAHTSLSYSDTNQNITIEMASYSAIAAPQQHQLSVPSSCRGETQSETSSTDSEMSNLHTIAAQLGMNMKELSIDQFKVEREKLETMMTGGCSGRIGNLPNELEININSNTHPQKNVLKQGHRRLRSSSATSWRRRPRTSNGRDDSR